MKVIEPSCRSLRSPNIRRVTPAPQSARPQSLKRDALSSLVHPGGLVYVPGASGAPLAFVSSVLLHPEHQKDLRVLTSYVPGINIFDMESMDASVCVTGLFMHGGLRAAQRSGQYRCLPLSYAGFVRHVLDQVEPDLTVIQVAPPPDAQGNCSMGPAVEFMPSVLKGPGACWA